MGNCFSDPSSHPSSTKPKSKITGGGGQKLGSGPAQTLGGSSAAAAHAPPKQRYNDPPRVLGSAGEGNALGASAGATGMGEEEQRERMRIAAEERAKSASTKGVTTSNPKAGQLSAKLAAERRAGQTSPQKPNERLMDKGEWN